MALRISAFPKCYIETIVAGGMSVFEWIKMARALDADGLEMFDGFLTSLEPGYLDSVGEAIHTAGFAMPMLCCSPDFTNRDRDARLKIMDAQGMEGAFFFPTLGVGMEEALIDDPPAVVAAFRAFNRWLAEDWGFAYRERIFAAPYVTLVDLDEACPTQRATLLQDRIGDGSDVRRDPLQIAGNVDMQRTRLDALRPPFAQSPQVVLRCCLLQLAHPLLGGEETTRRLPVTQHEHTRREVQVLKQALVHVGDLFQPLA